MAQDFIGTFYTGDDDRGIGTLQFDGVALAAIQGLNQRLETSILESEARTQKLEEKNALLES